jgi:endonuclease G
MLIIMKFKHPTSPHQLREASMKIRSLMIAFILTFLASVAMAAPTACPQHYLDGQAPDFLNEKVAQKTQEVCYSNYALVHSGITRTSLISAEHLTPAALTQDHPARKNTFHPDPNLKAADKAELEDYEQSGYDRGHMTPSADMPDAKSQHESFSLANMVPQNPNNNEQLWKAIEATTRELAINSGELYVVTGPVFSGSELKKLNNRVLVPTHIFKAIYDPKQKQAAAYLVKNVKGVRYAVIPIAEVEQLTGIAVFPTLSDDVKRSPMALPKPKLGSGPGAAVEDKTLEPLKPAP